MLIIPSNIILIFNIIYYFLLFPSLSHTQLTTFYSSLHFLPSLLAPHPGYINW